MNLENQQWKKVEWIITWCTFPKFVNLKKGVWEPQDGDQNDVPHLETFHKQIICTSPFPIFINFID